MVTRIERVNLQPQVMSHLINPKPFARANSKKIRLNFTSYKKSSRHLCLQRLKRGRNLLYRLRGSQDLSIGCFQRSPREMLIVDWNHYFQKDNHPSKYQLSQLYKEKKKSLYSQSKESSIFTKYQEALQVNPAKKTRMNLSLEESQRLEWKESITLLIMNWVRFWVLAQAMLPCHLQA